MHLCWGNYEGPHHCDVPLADIVDIVLEARPAMLSLEAANPRHAHEFAVFEKVKLPEGKVLIPGVIESKSNFIEHPEVIANRISNYARLVGRENVIAGSDCGYGTWVGQAAVDPDIVWAKLAALVGGRAAGEPEILVLSQRRLGSAVRAGEWRRHKCGRSDIANRAPSSIIWRRSTSPGRSPQGRDLLVEVRAVSVNPVDYKVASGGGPGGAASDTGAIKVVGYDAAGVVAEAGARRGSSSRATKCSTPAASAAKARTWSFISSTSGSWGASRARSISPPPLLCP